VRLVTEG